MRRPVLDGSTSRTSARIEFALKAILLVIATQAVAVTSATAMLDASSLSSSSLRMIVEQQEGEQVVVEERENTSSCDACFKRNESLFSSSSWSSSSFISGPGEGAVNRSSRSTLPHQQQQQQRRPDKGHADDALKPGDLDRMFERILSDPYYQALEPVVLSRPSSSSSSSPVEKGDEDGLWLVQFDNFLTLEEARHLMELGEESGYEPSQTTGQHKRQLSRTSYNTWCIMDDCHNDPIHQKLLLRVANLTGISETNYEYTQMPRYSKGQYYHWHYDFIPEPEQQQQQSTSRSCWSMAGPRVLTLYVYLNDVEQGGGTEFPEVLVGSGDGGGAATVMQPKTGRAVLWPNVLNGDPYARDDRSRHAALPVLGGIKYGANIWIHQRNFKDAFDNDCYY